MNTVSYPVFTSRNTPSIPDMVSAFIGAGRPIDRVERDGTPYGDSFHSDPRNRERARDTIRHVLANGGATITRGYDPAIFCGVGTIAVGGKVPAMERYVPESDFSQYTLSISLEALESLARDLERFIVSAPSFIIPTWVGIWEESDRNGSRFTFDIVTLHSWDDAGSVAVSRNQRAVFDGVSKSVYEVSPDGIIIPF